MSPNGVRYVIGLYTTAGIHGKLQARGLPWMAAVAAMTCLGQSD
jgi:hypothetical protein